MLRSNLDRLLLLLLLLRLENRVLRDRPSLPENGSFLGRRLEEDVGLEARKDKRDSRVSEEEEGRTMVSTSKNETAKGT